MQLLTLVHSVTAPTESESGPLTITDSITAPTQGHDTAVTQTTSGIKQIVSVGVHGYYSHKTGIQRGGSHGRYLRITTLQPDRVGRQRISLRHSIFASTQDHSVEEAQTTSGIEQIVAGGSHGVFAWLFAIQASGGVTSSGHAYTPTEVFFVL